MNFINLLLTFSINDAHAALTYDEVILAIKRRDTTTRAQKARLDARESNALAAKLGFLPSLEAGYTQTKAFKTPNTSNRSYLRANLNIFNGARDYYLLQATSFEKQASNYDVTKTKLEAEYEAMELVTQYIQRYKNWQVDVRRQTLAKDSYDSARKRFNSSMIPLQEKQKSEVDLAQAKAQSESSEIEYLNLKAQMIQLLALSDYKGDPEDSLVKIDKKWPWQKLLESINLKKVSKIQYQENLRPRTKALQNIYQASLYRKKSTYSNFSPKLDLSYTFSRDEITENINPFLVGFNRSDQTALLTVTFPLFDGWSSVATYRDQAATNIENEARYKEALREDFALWSTIKTRLIKAIKTAQARQKSMSLSRKIYNTSFARFKSGRASVNDLQIDQRRALQSEFLTNNGWAQAHILFTRFCHLQALNIKECKKKYQ